MKGEILTMKKNELLERYGKSFSQLSDEGQQYILAIQQALVYAQSKMVGQSQDKTA